MRNNTSRKSIIVVGFYIILIIVVIGFLLLFSSVFPTHPLMTVGSIITTPSKNVGTTKNMPGDAFVQRSGMYLTLNGHRFRFSGSNIYWLGLQETNHYVSYPSSFRVNDALATAAMMGETVVRSHTLGISVGCPLCLEPSLGVFNDEAFQHIDYAIQTARKYHIRLIIPLTDNWQYYHGGKHTFTEWRGILDERLFYISPLVINDFEQYIKVIMNHVNRYNGIAYKDDPTILAWETGNELSAPASWVRTVGTYIKSIDHHHLLMDGNYEQANQTSNFLSDLTIAPIDIYTGHYYPPKITQLQTEMRQANNAHKVFIVGEYDWNTNSGDQLVNFLSFIERSSVAGDMYWSLFSHDDDYGYVQQEEHFTLHYPGDTPNMFQRINFLIHHAYVMQGRSLVPMTKPGKPSITFIDGDAIAWRGAVGAYIYTIERSSTSIKGPWTVICDRCATDNSTPWVDLTKPKGSLWYRVKAYSVLGIPGPYSIPFYVRNDIT